MVVGNAGQAPEVPRREGMGEEGYGESTSDRREREFHRAEERSDDGENPSERSENTSSEARISAPQARNPRARRRARETLSSSEASIKAPQARGRRRTAETSRAKRASLFVERSENWCV